MSKLFDFGAQPVPSNLLKDRFIVPPFSILDTKQGYWQDRKRNWLKLGIQSELGRGDKLLYNLGNYNYDADVIERHTTKGDGTHAKKGDPRMTFDFMTEEWAEKYGRKAQQTSIFDPVLCEISYKWFSRDNDKVLDPFAGGSVRGIVAGSLNRQYTGIDLSEIQIDANKQQYKDISANFTGIVEPNWICGDSTNVKELVNNEKFNFIFSCPPYYNLEIYSTMEEDLSHKETYEEFLDSYEQIIKNACDLLEDDSFAVFVVGNVRNETDGGYYDFAGDTIRAFQKAGLIWYNDGIIVNVIGTLPVRTPKQFNASRKIGKQHQNYLVFYKGDVKRIKDKFGSFEELNDD